MPDFEYTFEFTPAAVAAGNKADPGIDWALDPSTHDLIFPLRYTKGPAAVAQGIKIRILMFFGEWFLNTQAGIKYFEDILGQKFNETKVRNAFRDAILDAPGVQELLALTATFTRATRICEVKWTVKTSFGTLTDSLPIKV